DWNASAYLAALPRAAIGELHLAGHSVRRLDGGLTVRLDDHGSPVASAVWTLYAEALTRFGPVPTLIEWDTNIPPIEVLLDEAGHAAALLDRVREETGHVDAA
ncbi:MAG: multinuclear nonheme iron-dependent oxidase, partial [Stellaceae bacterium]